MEYNKLIRDKIPGIIKEDKKKPITHIADDSEYWEKLRKKLEEEVDEFLQESTKEELADILEVVYAIRDFRGIEPDELESLRAEKARKRGGFKKKIILERTVKEDN